MNQFYQFCHNEDEDLLNKKKKWIKDYCIRQDWPQHWWQLTHGNIYQTAQFEGNLSDRKLSFPGSLFCLNNCQGPQIVIASSQLLSLSEILYQQVLLFICVWRVRSTVYLVSFRNFLNTLSCLLPEYNGTSLYKEMLHHSLEHLGYQSVLDSSNEFLHLRRNYFMTQGSGIQNYPRY